MCGPSGSQVALENSQQDFATQLQSNYGTLFSEQQGAENQLKDVLSPIFEAGPSQTGMSPEQLAALNTQAIDSSGAQFSNAERALGSSLAGRGGSTGLESGIEQQLKSGVASEAASNLANEQLGITNENYNLGRQNWQTANAGLLALSGQYNPAATGGLGTQANEQAFNEATTNYQEGQQGLAMVGGLVGSGLSALSGGLGNLDTTGGSSGLEQAGNFLEGI